MKPLKWQAAVAGGALAGLGLGGFAIAQDDRPAQLPKGVTLKALSTGIVGPSAPVVAQPTTTVAAPPVAPAPIAASAPAADSPAPVRPGPCG